ncbi:hypothetical protein PVAP13_5NG645950 [Panicum virgatum]|uniref:Uncharacterized protein n=1 Tax=Panicum virgatum TaxID=38727 RepID=A0A8T0SC64_PANVG|nr:hypothetical protein PVAP13_5NG645950 [Panicum virgatum]
MRLMGRDRAGDQGARCRQQDLWRHHQSRARTHAELAGKERKKGINAISETSPTQPDWK